MRIAFFLLLLATGLLFACGNEETESNPDVTIGPDPDDIVDSVNDEFAIYDSIGEARMLEAIPEQPDSMKGLILMDAGNNFQRANDLEKAILAYQKIYDECHGFVDRPMALLMQGFLYEDLDRYGDARDIYEEFLAEFPGHPLEEDTKFLLLQLTDTM